MGGDFNLILFLFCSSNVHGDYFASALGGVPSNLEFLMSQLAAPPRQSKKSPNSGFNQQKSNHAEPSRSRISVEGLDEIFGDPPLIYGEHPKDYEALEHSIRSTLSPVDALEEIWTRDIIDAQWEILRYKKIKASILNASKHRSLESLKVEVLGPFDSKTDLKVKTYDEALKVLNLPQDALLAKGYIIYLDRLTEIENNIHKLECRRNQAYKQLEEYRNKKSKKRSDVIDLQARDVEEKK